MLNHYILQYGKWLGTHENVTDLYKTMDVNFYAYIMTATHALPALKKSKGSIIVMNSNMGKSSNGNIQPHTYLLKEYKAYFHEYWLPYSLVFNLFELRKNTTPVFGWLCGTSVCYRRVLWKLERGTYT